MKRYLAFLATLATLLTVFLSVSPALAASPPPIQLPTSYSDYGSWGWAQGDLSNAVEWQIMQGMSVGVMSPGSTLTRAQIVTMLARAMGNAQLDPTQTSTTVPFPDITAQTNGVGYAYQPLQALLADGVVNPTMYPSGFAPTDPASRAETAALLYRALVYYGGNLGNANTSFSDLPASQPTVPVNGAVVQTSDILGAAKAGIIKGFDQATCSTLTLAFPCFDSAGNLTRAQAATMIVRFVKALPGSEQLLMQTPYLPALMSQACADVTEQACKAAQAAPAATILTNADVPANLPTTEAAWQAAPYASWEDIHLALATQNWIWLGEMKLDSTKAQYVADYGLQLWQKLGLAAVANYYADFNLGASSFPLLIDLYPNDKAIGSQALAPASMLQLISPSIPWAGPLGTQNASTFIQLNVNGTAGEQGLLIVTAQGNIANVMN